MNRHHKKNYNEILFIYKEEKEEEKMQKFNGEWRLQMETNTAKIK